MIDLSTVDARKQLVSKYAGKWGMSVDLVCAVVEQESAWNQWAMRYEPDFYAKYVDPLVKSGAIKTQTEATARATSFGLGQTMGQVARELGFTGQFLTEICDPEIGLDLTCHKLNKCFVEFPGDQPRALARYNGGANLGYAFEVLARVAKYQEGAQTDGK